RSYTTATLVASYPSFSSGYADPRDLHSFPTRRSSDLVGSRGPPPGVQSGLRRLADAHAPHLGPLLQRFPGELAGVLGGELVVERSEEHTSELQSRENLVCRLLLEKKNNITGTSHRADT